MVRNHRFLFGFVFCFYSVPFNCQEDKPLRAKVFKSIASSGKYFYDPEFLNTGLHQSLHGYEGKLKQTSFGRTSQMSKSRH